MAGITFNPILLRMDRVEYEKVIIQDLLNLERNGELNLAPWYQRRSVWNNAQKAYLINTLFEQKPIPSLYVRHSLDIDSEKSIREVVDGQQRIRAILEFVNGGFAARHPDYTKKTKYLDLKKKDVEKFKLTAISVGYLLGATDEDVIEIFGRLNSVSKTLNEQEKRNANFSGDFKQFCLAQSSMRVSVWRELGIFTANDIARMNEVLFISDLVINLIDGLSDYSASKITAAYKAYDDDFPQMEKTSKRLESIFSQVAAIKPEAIADTGFSRPPLFFSLCLAIDAAPKRIPSATLEKALFRIDERLNSDIPISERSKSDSEFYIACTSSTQRIKQRRVRDNYIKKFLGF